MPGWLLRYGPTLAVGIALSLGLWFAYSWAWDRGYGARDTELRAETRALQKRLHALSDRLSQRTVELEAARAMRADLERELSDEAAQDPMAGDPGLSADSLRRLDRIR